MGLSELVKGLWSSGLASVRSVGEGVFRIELGFEMSHPRSFLGTDIWVESILLFPTLPTCL